MADEIAEKENISQNRSKKISSNVYNSNYYTQFFNSNSPSYYELPRGESHSNKANVEDVTYSSANEYAAAVRSWLKQYYSWYQFQTMQMTIPYYMMGYMSAQPSALRPGATSSTTQPSAHNRTDGRDNNQHTGQALHANGLNQRVQRDFRIAPVWKRVAAELFDFLLLFMMKLAVTIVAVEHMGIMGEPRIYTFLKDSTIDYKATSKDIFEAMMSAFLYRCWVCMLETLCLRKGIAGMVGGTTPGKRFMGIRVVSCEELVIDLGNGLVRITPAGDIGFWNALVRSVIKNFSLAFFFPVCFTALFFQHHRAAYDVISNCIVVEPVQQRR